MKTPAELRSLEYIERLRAKAFVLSTSFTLQHSPKQLWPYISNTDMVNYKISLAPVDIRLRPAPAGGSEMTVESREMGFKIAYEELPYEWQQPFELLVERIFSYGPVLYYRWMARLEEKPDGQTQAHLQLDIVPSIPAFLVRPKFLSVLKRIRKTYESIDRVVQGEGQSAIAPFLAEPQGYHEKITRLNSRWASLATDSRIAQVVAEYVYTAPERYALKMRPFELSHLYQLDSLKTLQFFLKATKAGFLNLSWDLLCPSCKGAKEQATTLSAVNPNVHCNSCAIDYTLNFDENFELTFSPVPTLRELYDAPFCAGSPANTAHIVLQKNLWPGQSVALELHLKPGLYRLRALTMTGHLDFEVLETEGLAAYEFVMSEVCPEQPHLQLAQHCSLQVSNPQAVFQTLKIEDLAWREQRVTAGLVSSLQDFRDMFGAEVLRPGVQIAVTNLAMLFTDLKDSTLMYDQQGDAYAFNLVQDHFELMLDTIRIHDGAVVKTIGDAVMAVFQDTCKALSCCIAIQKRFTEWNQEHPERPITIKVGLHRGPCLALNLNDQLDYFGATVNKAARVQNESVGKDIIISTEVMQSEGITELIEQSIYEVVPLEKNLKGITGVTTLYRLLEP